MAERFTATFERVQRTATAFTVPDEVVGALGAGRRPPVVATVAGHSWRTTISRRDGRYYLVLNRAAKDATGLDAGDRSEVTLEVDTEPRVVEPPADLAEALAERPDAGDAWRALAPSHRRAYLEWIDSAKRAETRERRIGRSVEMLAEGRKDPSA